MRKLSGFILVIFLSFGVTSRVLSQISEGVITYEIKMETDDEAMAEMMTSMASSMSMVYSFKDELFKTNMDMGMMTTLSISDGNTETSLTLMNMTAQGVKWAIPMSKEEMEKIKEENLLRNPKIDVTDEKKMIVSYECTRVNVNYNDSTSMVMYVTDQIKPKNLSGEYAVEGVEGYPLQIVVQMNQMGMEMEFVMLATEVLTKVEDDSIFDMTIPDGYEIMTMEEVKSMGGGF